MKKLPIIVFVISASVFLFSCSNHFFNPKYYYGKDNNNRLPGDNTPPPPPLPPQELPEGTKDPFKDGEWNDPHYGGYDGSIFDSWLFEASFYANKENLPAYNFREINGKSWLSGGVDWKGNPADYYKPEEGANMVYGSPVGDTKIQNLTIYKYSGNNPLYDKSGYLQGRMDRFRFYSIDGNTAGGLVTLRQYLIAVDTYSKFIFAYGKITATQPMFDDKVPTDFKAIEYYAKRIPFYEYDPIGYVDKSGAAVLYDHYNIEFPKNPTGYEPSQHGFDAMAQHDKSKPGKSPYLPITDEEAAEEDKKTFYENIADLVAKDFNWRDYSGYEATSPAGKAQIADVEQWAKDYAGKSLTLYTYTLTDAGNKLTVKETDFAAQRAAKTTEYTMEKITAADKALYTDSYGNNVSVTIIEEQDSAKTISISGKKLDPDFKDYGPIFTDRVRGTKFVNNSSFNLLVFSTFVDTGATHAKIEQLTYAFTSDGTEITMSYYHTPVYGVIPGSKEHRTQKFKLARFDSDADKQWTAKYECTTTTGSLGNYVRVVLRNGGETDTPKPDEIGTVMRMSMTLHPMEGVWNIPVIGSIPDNPTSNLGLDLTADRVQP